MQNKTIRSLATLFGIGYLPIMPGTFASIAGLFLYLIIRNNLYIYLALTAIFIVLGFAVSGKAQELFKKTDPKEIVIDELCGILIVYILVPFSIFNVIIGFIIFRLIDILKVYPLSRLERLKKGWGIMLDDIAAGIFTNIILQVITHIRGILY